MLIYDKDEDILTMADFDDEMMIQETSKGGHSLAADSADKLVTVQEEKLQEEADTLRQQLTDARMMVQKLQSSLVLEQAKSNSLNSSLRIQLKRNQEALRIERINADRRLGEVLAHLLFLEGQLKREQKHVQTVMKQKDEIIKKQQQKIDIMTQTNERLVQAVYEAYSRKGKNGSVLGSFESCSSESLKENIKGKDKDKSKVPHKGKFESMRDRLWHHKSSLDLSNPETDMKKLRSRMFSSHENLSAAGLHKRDSRDKKCRSIAGYPECSDFFPEIPEGNELKGDNMSSQYENRLMENGEGLQSDEDEDQKFSAIPFQHYNEKSGMTSVGSMPILSQRDTNADFLPSKERPHSTSGVEYISSPSTKSEPSPVPQSPQTPSSESNPFKNLKTILKRKGSKSKNKKRNVSISQSPAQEVSVKEHFKKYNMS